MATATRSESLPYRSNDFTGSLHGVSTACSVVNLPAEIVGAAALFRAPLLEAPYQQVLNRP